ncbi:hypothetical protein HTV45_15410 [Streptomyces sp. CHD11]|uniref:hypothetical protein n=1 Tax=Streptomyces sp. CHD11 TaxID=2741325 RepID=UPI001BFC9C80|nr:hypothetical protein [Streptomyces sp. CHD11]MBT3152255.1 hypothetical protein [Streptomyces sp. CHD11]
MRRRAGLATVLFTASVSLLGGCTPGSGTAGDRSAGSPRPNATTTVAPDSAARLADRYRKAGGSEDVYGIQRADGPGGVPVLTVWTRDADDDAEPFDRLKVSLTDYLGREEGVDLSEGYLIDVFGPDGSLQHRLDARP